MQVLVDQGFVEHMPKSVRDRIDIKSRNGLKAGSTKKRPYMRRQRDETVQGNAKVPFAMPARTFSIKSILNPISSVPTPVNWSVNWSVRSHRAAANTESHPTGSSPHTRRCRGRARSPEPDRAERMLVDTQDLDVHKPRHGTLKVGVEGPLLLPTRSPRHIPRSHRPRLDPHQPHGLHGKHRGHLLHHHVGPIGPSPHIRQRDEVSALQRLAPLSPRHEGPGNPAGVSRGVQHPQPVGGTLARRIGRQHRVPYALVRQPHPHQRPRLVLGNPKGTQRVAGVVEGMCQERTLALGQRLDLLDPDQLGEVSKSGLADGPVRHQTRASPVYSPAPCPCLRRRSVHASPSAPACKGWSRRPGLCERAQHLHVDVVPIHLL
eukprot:169675-Hanusia_phi.AAC.1